MRPVRAWTVLGMLAAALPAAAAYKCQSADGRVAFQEMPCAAADKESTIRVAPRAPAEHAPVSAVPQERSPELRSAINNAILHSIPMRGMTLSELRSAVGEPNQLNSGDYPDGYTEQRIYNRPTGTLYVYTDGSTVRAVQNSPLGPQVSQVGASSQQVRPCPSEQEIKNAETSANSITITATQRRDLQRRVSDMRRCR